MASGSNKQLTIEECQRWIKNHQINPLTGRRIVIYGATYERIRRQCEAYGLVKDKTAHCEARGIPLDKNEAELYDKSYLIPCKFCASYAQLYFIHEEGGDYSCCRCNNDGNLSYFCIKCKNSEHDV